MNVDINKYAINKDFVFKKYKAHKELKGDEELSPLISLLACATMCPCIVVGYWIGEASNWHPDVVESIKRLTKFYGYTNIMGKPPGAPI
jgi:hypothetical protein